MITLLWGGMIRTAPLLVILTSGTPEKEDIRKRRSSTSARKSAELRLCPQARTRNRERAVTTPSLANVSFPSLTSRSPSQNGPLRGRTGVCPPRARTARAWTATWQFGSRRTRCARRFASVNKSLNVMKLCWLRRLPKPSVRTVLPRHPRRRCTSTSLVLVLVRGSSSWLRCVLGQTILCLFKKQKEASLEPSRLQIRTQDSTISPIG